MLKKLRASVKQFLKTPVLPEVNIGLMTGMPHIDEDPNERHHRENIENIGVVGLRLQRQAFQHQLTIMHRSMLIALFAALIALIIGVFALVHKPNVTVKVYQQPQKQVKVIQ